MPPIVEYDPPSEDEREGDYPNKRYMNQTRFRGPAQASSSSCNQRPYHTQSPTYNVPDPSMYPQQSPRLPTMTEESSWMPTYDDVNYGAAKRRARESLARAKALEKDREEDEYFSGSDYSEYENSSKGSQAYLRQYRTPDYRPPPHKNPRRFRLAATAADSSWNDPENRNVPSEHLSSTFRKFEHTWRPYKREYKASLTHRGSSKEENSPFICVEPVKTTSPAPFEKQTDALKIEFAPIYIYSEKRPPERSTRMPIPLPTPVPELNKKSRGRRAPTMAERESSEILMEGKKKNRVWSCEVDGCRKSFGRSEHLKRHIRSLHTNEKPFPCTLEGCSKAFSRHDNLLQHRKLHQRLP